MTISPEYRAQVTPECPAPGTRTCLPSPSPLFPSSPEMEKDKKKDDICTVLGSPFRMICSQVYSTFMDMAYCHGTKGGRLP